MSEVESQNAHLESLREALWSGELSKQWKALSALVAIGTPEAAEMIAAVIRDGDETTAARAANLAKRNNFQEAVPAAIERLQQLSPDANPTHTSLMLHVLAMSPEPAAMPVLTRYVAHPNRHVRLAAARGLAVIGTAEARGAVAEAATGLSRFSAWRLTRRFEQWSRRVGTA